jgi:multiple sugar transport system substrate-binding protein
MTKAVVTLRGMTWDHPRGFDPLLACSKIWRAQSGVEVQWDRRSLQDFESFPIKRLAEQYDLIVVDHPHMGRVTAEHCLLPMDRSERQDALYALKKASVGPSFESYRWAGHQWALPIDAAAQVQAWRPDKLAGPLGTWREIVLLAEKGRVRWPLRPPHSLMSLYTLCGQLGRSCRVEGPDHIDAEAGTRAFAMMRELGSCLDPVAFSQDPIAVFDEMAQDASEVACAPLIYGYVSYAKAGFRPRRIAFADNLVVENAIGPRGSALGGTGIAVSSNSSFVDAAMDFAFWLASADTQRGPYAAAGGQPGHDAAWNDPDVNGPVLDFYRATRATLEGAWVRPRHDGYMRFQDVASQELNAALQLNSSPRTLIARLNDLFRETLST